jgi:hypothetical protein
MKVMFSPLALDAMQVSNDSEFSLEVVQFKTLKILMSWKYAAADTAIKAAKQMNNFILEC